MNPASRFLDVDAWSRVWAYRCDTCAALLLNEEDLKIHEKWHDEMRKMARPLLRLERNRTVTPV